MKVKFANGTVKECAAPTEQKIFKTSGVGAGWVLALRLTGNINSTELDEIINGDNVKVLDFLTETESGEDKTIFSLTGYNKVTSSTIRHAEDTNATHAEIQISKGV